MKTSVEQIDGHTVKLTVTVPAADVDQAIERAYREIAKRVKVPGFRPGKVPRPVIDNQVGRDYVLSEAQEDVLQQSYLAAVDSEELSPIASPEVAELDDLVAGEEFMYTAEVQVKPELTLSSIEGITVAVPTGEASDREVDAQIAHTRDRFASLEPVVEGRGIEADDFVLLSFVGTVDGQAYEGNTVDKYLYEMGHGLMPPEFDAGLIGLNPGDTTEVEFTIPENSSNQEFVGKTAHFDITVHEIKARVLPELDDEFASNAGGYETFEEMRADTKAKLDETKRTGRERMLGRNAREVLAERLEGDVPEAMVNSRNESMIRDFADGLQQRGMTIEQYVEATGYDMNKIAEDMKTQAEMMVREELALEALFRAVGMEVTEADVDEEIARFAEVAGTTAEDIRARWEDTRAIEVLTEQIMHTKAVEWVTDPANVEITEEEPREGEADPADTEE